MHICTQVLVIYRIEFIHISHVNTHTLRNAHCIFVLTYYRAFKQTYIHMHSRSTDPDGVSVYG